jgi:hypothetical protein
MQIRIEDPIDRADPRPYGTTVQCATLIFRSLDFINFLLSGTTVVPSTTTRSYVTVLMHWRSFRAFLCARRVHEFIRNKLHCTSKKTHCRFLNTWLIHLKFQFIYRSNYGVTTRFKFYETHVHVSLHHYINMSFAHGNWPLNLNLAQNS